MKRFCEQAIEILSSVTGRHWADEYVRLRMDFHRKHGHGLILSIFHGSNFFDMVLEILQTGDFSNYDEPKGLYRDNFIKLIKLGMKESA